MSWCRPHCLPKAPSTIYGLMWWPSRTLGMSVMYVHVKTTIGANIARRGKEASIYLLSGSKVTWRSKVRITHHAHVLSLGQNIMILAKGPIVSLSAIQGSQPKDGRFCILLDIWQTCNLDATLKYYLLVFIDRGPWWQLSPTLQSRSAPLCPFIPFLPTGCYSHSWNVDTLDFTGYTISLTVAYSFHFHESSLCPSCTVCPTRCVSNPHVLWLIGARPPITSSSLAIILTCFVSRHF